MADTQLTISSARASDVYTTFVAADAIDGDTGTNWSASNNGNHWLEVDLGLARFASKLRVHQSAAGEEYDVWASADGLAWRKVLASTAVNDDLWTDLRFHPIEARYFLVRHTAGNDWASLNEVEVWMEETPVSFPGGTQVMRYLAGSDFANQAVCSASTTYSASDVNKPPLMYGYNLSANGDKWVSNGAAEGEWWKIDLGEALDISRVLVYTANNSNVDFTVEVSTDDSSWSAFDTAKVGASSYTNPLTFTDTEVSARYVRVTGGNVSGGDWMEVSGLFVEKDADVVEWAGGGGGGGGLSAMTRRVDRVSPRQARVPRHAE